MKKANFNLKNGSLMAGMCSAGCMLPLPALGGNLTSCVPLSHFLSPSFSLRKYEMMCTAELLRTDNLEASVNRSDFFLSKFETEREKRRKSLIFYRVWTQSHFPMLRNIGEHALCWYFDYPALVKFSGTWEKVYSLWQHFIIHPNMV